MAGIYGAGAAMGFAPGEVDRMSIWQFFAALDGWRSANDPSAGKAMTDDEADDLWSWMKERNGD